MDFNELVERITKDFDSITLNIKSKPKKIKAMVKLTSINYDGSPYIKVLFEDNSFLLLIIDPQELYYTDVYETHIEDQVSDEMLGNEKLTINGKEYILDNPEDYQYVLELYKGTILDIEGEVKFYDYVPTDGSKEIMSLGWIMRTGKRADVNPTMIDISEIKITD